MKKEDEDEQAIRLAALLLDANRRGDQKEADRISSLIKAMGYDK